MYLPALGLDMSARVFVAALMLTEKGALVREFTNDQRGFRALQRWLRQHFTGKVRAGIEATNVYGHALAAWLQACGHEVYLLNPERVAHYCKALGQRNKTDPADAGSIARFVANHNDFTPWRPRAAAHAALQSLTRTRAQLVAVREQVTNQLRTASEPGRALLQQAVTDLKARVADAERAIRQLLREHPELGEQVRRLRTIKGVGEVTAAVFIAELPPIDQASDPRTLAAFAGLIPRQWRSGTLVLPARLSRKGNDYLREALYMPALVARRYNPVLHAYAQRLKARGKRSGAILGAVAHKLLRIMVGVLRHNADFDPNWKVSQT